MWISCVSSVMCISKIIAPHLYLNTRIVYNRSKDNFSYRSKLRTLIINQNDLSGKVENHHIIPKQFKGHKILDEIHFDINGSHNICMLPNKYFDKSYGKHPIIHYGGHKAYDKFVKVELDNLVDLKGDDLKYRFWIFIMHLKSCLENNDPTMPWRY